MAVSTPYNPYMIYKQWLDNENARLAESFNGAITYAAEERRRKEQAALLAKQEADAAATERYDAALLKANDAFERDRVTYGQAAERLAQAGLTGSGVSDNMTRDAYASRALLYSDANRTKAAEEHSNALTYRDAMEKAASDEADLKYAAEESKKTAASTIEGLEADFAVKQAEKYSRYKSGGYSEYTLADIDANFSPEDAKQLKADNMDAVIGDFVDSVNYDSPENIAASIKGIEKLYNEKHIDKDTYDAVMQMAESDPTALSARYRTGLIDSKTYLDKIRSTGKADSGKVQSGWHIADLKNGSEVQEIYVTIGSTEKGENAIRASLGKKVSDESTEKALNTIATGNGDVTPDRASGWSAFWGGEDRNSKESNGQLVVYNGTAYVYTKRGWFPIGDEVAAAFLADSVYPKTLTK